VVEPMIEFNTDIIVGSGKDGAVIGLTSFHGFELWDEVKVVLLYYATFLVSFVIKVKMSS